MLIVHVVFATFGSSSIPRPSDWETGTPRREEYIISPGLRPERDIQPFEFTVKFLLRRSK